MTFADPAVPGGHSQVSNDRPRKGTLARNLLRLSVALALVATACPSNQTGPKHCSADEIGSGGWGCSVTSDCLCDTQLCLGAAGKEACYVPCRTNSDCSPLVSGISKYCNQLSTGDLVCDTVPPGITGGGGSGTCTAKTFYCDTANGATGSWLIFVDATHACSGSSVRCWDPGQAEYGWGKTYCDPSCVVNVDQNCDPRSCSN